MMLHAEKLLRDCGLTAMEYTLAIQQHVEENREHIAAARRQTARTGAFLTVRGYRRVIEVTH